MAKRLFDLVFSLLSLLLLTPLFLLLMVVIKLSSKGPALYITERAGVAGKPFRLYKLRTMHIQKNPGDSKITATKDPRIFRFGSFLRSTKLDELPQLLNVIKGDMSIVGPRPEDIQIVRQHYDEIGRDTLLIRPGIASPGSLFNYTHSNLFLNDEAPEQSYIESLLPVKLGIEKVYVEDRNIFYDIRIIFRTLLTIVQIAIGKRSFDFPKEYNEAKARGYVRRAP